jgi:hypothetical protein
MQPNFRDMTDRELKDYALAHREDDDAIEELIRRVDSNPKAHPYPESDEEQSEIERAFLQTLDRMQRK